MMPEMVMIWQLIIWVEPLMLFLEFQIRVLEILDTQFSGIVVEVQKDLVV